MEGFMEEGGRGGGRRAVPQQRPHTGKIQEGRHCHHPDPVVPSFSPVSTALHEKVMQPAVNGRENEVALSFTRDRQKFPVVPGMVSVQRCMCG